MTLVPSRLHIVTAFMILLVSGIASPAYADPCDELARSLSQQIDGLKVGGARGGIIYLQHPAATQASLGCHSRNRQGDFYAATNQKKPSADFTGFVASAVAQIFTIPKKDALRGVNRCLGRIGLLRGKDIKTRYRKLDINCAGTKTGTSVTVSRERDG
ncbi:hypothetical protein AFIC_001149 [[Pseudomonas] carboxydohydrogena]|uniref:Uncharacterized protein n=1 Tax=Afipia carboxydohydrogena TaxID=290 RepID=A0ABY8BSI2_AFICR|nr:hypothetical protein [[Pseudomonas] carboxydohydrogena]WEF52654.1 hypothetical protein AFIC_001149 [[Pseudomonas] carboxydohydrogena]